MKRMLYILSALALLGLIPTALIGVFMYPGRFFLGVVTLLGYLIFYTAMNLGFLDIARRLEDWGVVPERWDLHDAKGLCWVVIMETILGTVFITNCQTNWAFWAGAISAPFLVAAALAVAIGYAVSGLDMESMGV